VNFKINCPDSKPPKKYYTYIASNVSIVKAITKQIVIYAYFENTGSIVIGITRNLKSSKKSG